MCKVHRPSSYFKTIYFLFLANNLLVTCPFAVYHYDNSVSSSSKDNSQNRVLWKICSNWLLIQHPIILLALANRQYYMTQEYICKELERSMWPITVQWTLKRHYNSCWPECRMVRRHGPGLLSIQAGRRQAFRSETWTSGTSASRNLAA